MKTLPKIVLGVWLALAGCKLEVQDTFLNPNYQEKNLNGILSYVAENITYLTDEENYGRKSYFAPPEETFERKAGDCEDLSILDLYLLKRDLGIEGNMIGGIKKEEISDIFDMFEMILTNEKHTWIRVNNIDYEPQLGREYDFSDYIVFKEYSYNESMEMIE